MSAIAKSLPAVKAPQSQLKDAGASAKKAPIGQLAQMIAADLKGGEAKHDYQMGIIASAIYQAFKGNSRDIPEAVAICHGKSAKARAYLAGFTAILNDVKPVPYKGKFDSADNAVIRAEVDTLARHTALKFEEAYLLAVATIKAEMLDNREAKKAEKAASMPAAGGDETSSTAGALAESDNMKVDAAVLDIGATVDAMCDVIRAGSLTLAELAQMQLAIAEYEASEAYKVAIDRAMSATPATPATV